MAYWVGETWEEPTARQRQIVALTEGEADSREHAEALAWLAEGHAWRNEFNDAVEVADEAMAAAVRSGDTRGDEPRLRSAGIRASVRT